jgi:hypothetical protein
MSAAAPYQVGGDDDRHAHSCICCLSSNLRRTPAVLMPFLAKRIFNHDPVEITADWGLRDLRQGMAYSLCNTIECADCGAIFLDYRFSDKELSRLYKGYRGTEYNALRTEFEPAYAATASHYHCRAAYLEAVESALSRYLPSQPRVLDWGGDSGINSPFRFLAGKLHVYDISGVEVCAEVTKVSREECLANAYDLIVCSQVLEHVSYPVRVLQEITSLLRPETILYLEVPLEEVFRTTGECTARGSAKRHWHEHINFFSPTSLEALAQTCGLQILDYESMHISLGWRESAVQMLICKTAPPQGGSA